MIVEYALEKLNKRIKHGIIFVECKFNIGEVLLPQVDGLLLLIQVGIMGWGGVRGK